VGSFAGLAEDIAVVRVHHDHHHNHQDHHDHCSLPREKANASVSSAEKTEHRKQTTDNRQQRTKGA
jgi:hypothetical protein